MACLHAFATEAVKFCAHCRICNAPAPLTVRTRPLHQGNWIGGPESYASVCHVHWQLAILSYNELSCVDFPALLPAPVSPPSLPPPSLPNITSSPPHHPLPPPLAPFSTQPPVIIDLTCDEPSLDPPPSQAQVLQTTEPTHAPMQPTMRSLPVPTPPSLLNHDQPHGPSSPAFPCRPPLAPLPERHPERVQSLRRALHDALGSPEPQASSSDSICPRPGP